jgi:hypothetical protein
MWSDCKNVQNVGRMMIDRYTWTALCFLFLMGGIFCVSILGCYTSRVYWLDCFVHSCLVFGFLYCGCQIFDNILTVWWYFRSRDRFINPEED